MHTAQRTHGFTESVIRGMTRLAREHGAINLAQGFPDYDPPRPLLEALARHVLTPGHQQYAPMPGLDEATLRSWNGIGKDLAGRIREIALSGDCAIRQELLTEFPVTLLEVMRLQGVGPKTVAVLYRELRIRSLEDLEAAATAGFTWGVMEKILKGHASVLGMCSGIVAGLVVITPACGFVTANGAMIIGVLAAIIIPTVGKVRESAQRTVDASNLREILKAALLYAADHNDRLPDPAALAAEFPEVAPAFR